MKTAIILCLASIPALALDVDGNKLILNEAEMAHCASGCKLISNAQLLEVRAAIEKLLVELEIARKAKTCRKGDFV